MHLQVSIWFISPFDGSRTRYRNLPGGSSRWNAQIKPLDATSHTHLVLDSSGGGRPCLNLQHAVVHRYRCIHTDNDPLMANVMIQQTTLGNRSSFQAIASGFGPGANHTRRLTVFTIPLHTYTFSFDRDRQPEQKYGQGIPRRHHPLRESSSVHTASLTIREIL